MSPGGTASGSAEVYAVKFGEARVGRQAGYFMTPPPGLGDSTAHLDFMVWLVRTEHGDVVVDLGFTSATAQRRDRPHFREPSAALTLLGVDPAAVEHVVLTHLHYDHVGDRAPFTRARFVLQERELGFWVGRHAARHEFSRLVEADDVADLARLTVQGRVDLVDGDRDVVPGVRVHLVGGHTPGMQVVSVATADGTVVLASDASHLYAHLGEDRPASLATDLPGMYDAFDRIRSLTDRLDLVVPGHDPEVLHRFDPVPGLDGVAVRIA